MKKVGSKFLWRQSKLNRGSQSIVTSERIPIELQR